MKKNMGTTDSYIRFAAAVLIFTLNYTGVITGSLAMVLGILAVVFIITGFVKFCPLYTLFGYSTCPVENK